MERFEPYILLRGVEAGGVHVDRVQMLKWTAARIDIWLWGVLDWTCDDTSGELVHDENTSHPR